MPWVEPTFLGVVCVTAITIRSASAAGPTLIGSAERAPASRLTKPPKIERAAETEDARASALCSALDQARPAAPSAATASAAKPDALEARPDAVGKSLCEVTCAKQRS